MSEDTLIRLTNLRAYCAARSWGPAELGRATGRRTNQCSDMLRGEKSFGEKIARSFEEKLKLPRNWFDVPHDKSEVTDHAAADNVVREPVAPYKIVRISGSTEPEGRKSTAPPPSTEGASPLLSKQSSHVSARNGGLAPVVSWESLGETLHKTSAELGANEFRYFNSPGAVSDKAKWVQIQGNELAPELNKGDWVLFDPEHLKPKLGEVVLLSTMDHEYLIRRYRALPTRASEVKDFEVYDSADRSMTASRHGLKLVGTGIAMQRDRF